MFSMLPTMPTLNAATGMSSSTQRAWSATHSASSAITSSTPMVSWIVTAVTTDKGWQPMLASVSMSACKPAPPLGSVAANASTIGGNCKGAEGSIRIGIGCSEAGCIAKMTF